MVVVRGGALGFRRNSSWGMTGGLDVLCGGRARLALPPMERTIRRCLERGNCRWRKNALPGAGELGKAQPHVAPRRPAVPRRGKSEKPPDRSPKTPPPHVTDPGIASRLDDRSAKKGTRPEIKLSAAREAAAVLLLSPSRLRLPQVLLPRRLYRRPNPCEGRRKGPRFRRPPPQSAAAVAAAAVAAAAAAEGA